MRMMTSWPWPTRRCANEFMDDPALDKDLHGAALDGLARINRFSNSARLVWDPMAALARKHGLPQLSLLDVATGGGDVPIKLCQRAMTNGLDLRVTAIDKQATALEVARRRARCAGVSIDFHECDALSDAWPKGFDVVICSLFLHHLRDEQALALLQKMASAARRLIVVNDLARSAAGYVTAWVGTRLLTRSTIVHADGPLSVRAAFTPAEMEALARQAGLSGAVVQSRWLFRFVMTWTPSDTPETSAKDGLFRVRMPG